MTTSTTWFEGCECIVQTLRLLGHHDTNREQDVGKYSLLAGLDCDAHVRATRDGVKLVSLDELNVLLQPTGFKNGPELSPDRRVLCEGVRASASIIHQSCARQMERRVSPAASIGTADAIASRTWVQFNTLQIQPCDIKQTQERGSGEQVLRWVHASLTKENFHLR
jgi:hypothetical protein